MLCMISVLTIISAQLSSCGKSDARYRIGFSQCVGGAWREKVNMEMLSAQHLYNNVVDVDIKNADNISERQVAQIDSFINVQYFVRIIEFLKHHLTKGSEIAASWDKCPHRKLRMYQYWRSSEVRKS